MENTRVIITSVGHGLSWGFPFSLVIFLFIANAKSVD
jgi:hypothetical protein